MKLLMDADCLIKLTKAGLKELVLDHCVVSIPKTVEREIVNEGKKKNCSDAYVVETNIQDKKISVLRNDIKVQSGDEALVKLFKKERFDAVATDDVKLVRRLKTNGVPFVLPAVILHQLVTKKRMSVAEGLAALDQLSEFISEDETTTVRFLMEALK
jgi:rRNA-processing protein FCF1